MDRVILALLFLSYFLAGVPGTLQASKLYDKNLIPAVLTDQDAINSGTLSLTELFYRGAHIYTNRFTTFDHFGEAPDGPRRKLHSLASNPNTPFLRFNGLDAQSCFECHGAIGFMEYSGMKLPRDRGSMGGGASFASNVFIFDKFENMREGIVRNPPHTFGLGYVQRLSDEMTAELLGTRDLAVAAASAAGTTVTLNLTAKGISFGSLSADPDGSVDLSAVEGVSEDLVVRPFQFKGIASSIRNFVTGALNFHFSVQARELIDRGAIQDDNPGGMIADDPLYEIGDGEVSSIATFVAALRPPMYDTDGLDQEKLARGRGLFDSIGCADCHVPILRIDDPRVTIIDPRVLETSPANTAEGFVSLRAQTEGRAIPIVPAEASSALLAPVVEHETSKRRSGSRPAGFTFHLTDSAFPDEALPRLPDNPDGSIDVPLFSDLKRHNMGDYLADTVEQQTDVAGIFVQRHMFLTRPLWGVADTGPYLHDGRATTLYEAVLMHEGPNSEANSSIEQFRELEKSEQEELFEFLHSLRVRSLIQSGGEPPSVWVLR